MPKKSLLECNTLEDRKSMGNIIRPKNVFKELEEEATETLNDKLKKYKEFKLIYNKTNIQPIYFLYTLIICLILIFIGFLDTQLTLLISTVYPLYISCKTIQSGNREEIKKWLAYWVVCSLFTNIESVLGLFLQNIPMYFFFKIIFLLVLFLPQYNGAVHIYELFLKDLFAKYESSIYDAFVGMKNKINFPSETDLPEIILKEVKNVGKSYLVNEVKNKINKFE